MMNTPKIKRLRAILAKIAEKHLNIPTLDVRNRDSLDFHDCGVVSIEKALIDAYNQGFRDACEEIGDKMNKAG